jgi:ppGpp synthetase/RelA/SpoT-type nucleotidyltranferase
VRTIKLPGDITKQIEDAVQEYLLHRTDFYNLAKRVENDLIENQALKRHIHSTKFREKDPEHLRDKLRRKAVEALRRNKKFRITGKNLFAEVDDLAGVRLLHVYREQLPKIDPLIREVLTFHKYTFREKPKAYTWDIENQEFYSGLGFRVETNPSFYTSVHYVLQPHWRKWGCELQVRTLAEELWGEVSHTVNYPHPTRSVACSEQLAVLARVASGCTRLVDSIVSSSKEFDGFMLHPQENPVSK